MSMPTAPAFGGSHAARTPKHRRSLFSRSQFERTLLWIAMALSGVVFFEPAPFDLLILFLIGVWLFGGLHIPRSHTVPLVIVGILSVTGLLTATLSTTLVTSGRHVIISIFLYIVMVGLAAHVARAPARSLPIIFSGYQFAAIITTAAAVSAYFSLIGGTQELFLEHGRARGTFKDPNVFGPFLVPPLVYGFLRHLTGEDRLGLQSAILAFLGLGILLSFSRGAWASTIFSVGISTYLLFISARSNSLRLKVVGLAICTVVIAAALLVFALSFDAIANLMSVRGQFVQSYDTLERFAGARIAIDVILTHPLGIGAYSFAEFHEAEPHNAYLYSFLIGGWLGGFAFIALIVSTIIVAFRNTLVASPVRLFAIVLFSTFLAVSLQSLVVDTDHWRQLYILAGCIWGIHAWLHKPERGHETETAEKKMNALEPPLFPTLNQRFARLNQKARDTAANNNARTPRRTKWRRKLGGTHRPRNLARVTRIAAAKSERAAADPPAAPTQSNRVPSSGQPERADVSPHMQNRILRARYRDTVQAKPVSEPDVSEQTSPAVSRVIKDNDTALASSPREAFGIRASDNLAPRAEFGRRKT